MFDIDMERCPNCGGGEMKIIAAILQRPGIGKILSPAQVPDGVTAPSFISTVALGLAAAATATPTQTWLELV